MKVAFINQPWNTCPPARMGSIAIWTYEVARRIAAEHDVVVYARRGGGEPASEIRERMLFRRFDVTLEAHFNDVLEKIWSWVSPLSPLFASRLYYAIYAYRVARDLREQRCDVIHIQNMSQYIPSIATINPSAKIVLHMHCEWLTQLPAELIRERIAATDLLLGCSRHISEPISARFPNYGGSVRTVYNGVTVDGAHAISQESIRQAPVVLFVGRITPEKGIHVLLDAFFQVAAAFPKCKLRIVGPESITPLEFIVGRDNAKDVDMLRRFYGRSYLVQLAEMVPVELRDRIEFSGQVSHWELNPCYSAATVLVNPSLSESFGMTLIEAMVCGLPVIATRVGGMPEIVIDGDTGYLVEPNNTDQLADAICRVLGDPALGKRLGQAGRERATRTFSWDAIANDLLAAYGDVIEEGIHA